ncbi:MAG: hypothetical protein AAFY36_17800, partial [Bacteroidota bacterium]
MNTLNINRSYLLLILSIFISHLSLHSTSYDVIVKVNVIRGESMVTPQSDPMTLEELFESRLRELGYRTIDSVLDINNTLFADVFVYQFPADFPTVVITIRSNRGIHYFDMENNSFSLDRKTTITNHTAVLLGRFPSTIDMNTFYELRVNDVLHIGRISLIGHISNNITNSYKRNYSNGINWPSSEAVPFMFEDWFIYYLSYCVNLQGIRKKLKSEPIRLQVRIGSSCRLELIDINCSFPLKEKQVTRLHEA